MKDDLKKMEEELQKNGRQSLKKWKMTSKQKSTKINLIGCDTIVDSPKSSCLVTTFIKTPEWVVIRKEDFFFVHTDGGPRSQVNFFLPEFLLFFFRSPCKNLKPYNNPFCGFE